MSKSKNQDPGQLDLLEPEPLDDIPEINPGNERPANFLERIIEIKYSYRGIKSENQKFQGTISRAMDVALAEIFEHAGGGSPAYVFTQTIFDEISELANSLALTK